ncbi:polyketide cyclase [Pseudonocardiaceae bacterium YIM PH 21723]|nr:polyketide cyclase [Pseudonocardiaceae bacterium YIM PH 21723]
MVEVTRTFTVAATPERTLAYLRDFANTTEWDPGTQSCEQVSPGPIEVGTRWHNRSKIVGIKTELIYELIRSEPGRVVFRGTNKTASATDDMAVSPGDLPGTTRITYHATIDFQGAAKLVSPIAQVVFAKVGSDVVRSLTAVFERQNG